MFQWQFSSFLTRQCPSQTDHTSQAAGAAAESQGSADVREDEDNEREHVWNRVATIRSIRRVGIGTPIGLVIPVEPKYPHTSSYDPGKEEQAEDELQAVAPLLPVVLLLLFATFLAAFPLA